MNSKSSTLTMPTMQITTSFSMIDGIGREQNLTVTADYIEQNEPARNEYGYPVECQESARWELTEIVLNGKATPSDTELADALEVKLNELYKICEQYLNQELP